MKKKESTVQFLNKTRLRPVLMAIAEACKFDFAGCGVKARCDTELLLGREI